MTKPKLSPFARWVASLDLTYAKVGAMIECSPQRVSNLLHQGHSPSLELASRIAKASDGKVPVSSWGSK